MRQHFSEHFRLVEDEAKQLWNEADFIFDTNVLLNLYRMSSDTSLKIRSILKSLKGRLFLPHQVAEEFFKHAEETIAEQVNTFERVRAYLKRIPEQFKKEFSRHPCIPINEITQALNECIRKQTDAVNKSQSDNQLNFVVHDDPILAELAEIFSDCTEAPYCEVDNDALNKKVEERVQLNLPPCAVENGGKASSTPVNNPHRGDGRVWFQIVSHGERTKKSIIFVTADEKGNWWRKVKLGSEERAVGAHTQLIRDAESASGKRFIMYTQELFLEYASKYLGADDQTAAINEVRQIRDTTAREKLTVLSLNPKMSAREEFEVFEKAQVDCLDDRIDDDIRDEPKSGPSNDNLEKDDSKGEVDKWQSL